MKVKVYRDNQGEWRWVRIADNNEKLAESSEGYQNKGDCVEMAKRLNADAELVVEGEE